MVLVVSDASVFYCPMTLHKPRLVGEAAVPRPSVCHTGVYTQSHVGRRYLLDNYGSSDPPLGRNTCAGETCIFNTRRVRTRYSDRTNCTYRVVSSYRVP